MAQADERAALQPTLPALVGNLWCPAWAIRPGAYPALAPLASTMPLWLLLHSRNGDYWKPCYATRDQLGETLGVSRATVSRYLFVMNAMDYLDLFSRPCRGPQATGDQVHRNHERPEVRVAHDLAWTGDLHDSPGNLDVAIRPEEAHQSDGSQARTRHHSCETRGHTQSGLRYVAVSRER